MTHWEGQCIIGHCWLYTESSAEVRGSSYIIHNRWTLAEDHYLNNRLWLILLSFIVVFLFPDLSLLSVCPFHHLSTSHLCCFSVVYLCRLNTHTTCTSLMDSYRSRFSTKTFCNYAFFFQKTMLIVRTAKPIIRNVAYATNLLSWKVVTRILPVKNIYKWGCMFYETTD